MAAPARAGAQRPPAAAAAVGAAAAGGAAAAAAAAARDHPRVKALFHEFKNANGRNSNAINTLCKACEAEVGKLSTEAGREAAQIRPRIEEGVTPRTSPMQRTWAGQHVSRRMDHLRDAHGVNHDNLAELEHALDVRFELLEYRRISWVVRREDRAPRKQQLGFNEAVKRGETLEAQRRAALLEAAGKPTDEQKRQLRAYADCFQPFAHVERESQREFVGDNLVIRDRRIMGVKMQQYAEVMRNTVFTIVKRSSTRGGLSIATDSATVQGLRYVAMVALWEDNAAVIDFATEDEMEDKRMTGNNLRDVFTALIDKVVAAECFVLNFSHDNGSNFVNATDQLVGGVFRVNCICHGVNLLARKLLAETWMKPFFDASLKIQALVPKRVARFIDSRWHSARDTMKSALAVVNAARHNHEHNGNDEGLEREREREREIGWWLHYFHRWWRASGQSTGTSCSRTSPSRSSSWTPSSARSTSCRRRAPTSSAR